jgi:predicted neutral ceramidase superfamily lipid hydrolase
MVTLMETTNRRFRKGRGLPVSSAGRRMLDDIPFESELAVDNKLAVFGPLIDGNRLGGRWMNTVTRRPITREVSPW